ncbi:MAG: hypothetical protein JW803_08095 [Endomicrobiales bacterium]|nr:hypothetical protein [Endomicrobiales bacterium]
MSRKTLLILAVAVAIIASVKTYFGRYDYLSDLQDYYATGYLHDQNGKPANFKNIPYYAPDKRRGMLLGDKTFTKKYILITPKYEKSEPAQITYYLSGNYSSVSFKAGFSRMEEMTEEYLKWSFYEVYSDGRQLLRSGFTATDDVNIEKLSMKNSKKIMIAANAPVILANAKLKKGFKATLYELISNILLGFAGFGGLSLLVKRFKEKATKGIVYAGMALGAAIMASNIYLFNRNPNFAFSIALALTLIFAVVMTAAEYAISRHKVGANNIFVYAILFGLVFAKWPFINAVVISSVIETLLIILLVLVPPGYLIVRNMNGIDFKEKLFISMPLGLVVNNVLFMLCGVFNVSYILIVAAVTVLTAFLVIKEWKMHVNGISHSFSRLMRNDYLINDIINAKSVSIIILIALSYILFGYQNTFAHRDGMAFAGMVNEIARGFPLQALPSIIGVKPSEYHYFNPITEYIFILFSGYDYHTIAGTIFPLIRHSWILLALYFIYRSYHKSLLPLAIFIILAYFMPYDILGKGFSKTSPLATLLYGGSNSYNGIMITILVIMCMLKYSLTRTNGYALLCGIFLAALYQFKANLFMVVAPSAGVYFAVQAVRNMKFKGLVWFTVSSAGLFAALFVIMKQNFTTATAPVIIIAPGEFLKSVLPIVNQNGLLMNIANIFRNVEYFDLIAVFAAVLFVVLGLGNLIWLYIAYAYKNASHNASAVFLTIFFILVSLIMIMVSGKLATGINCAGMFVGPILDAITYITYIFIPLLIYPHIKSIYEKNKSVLAVGAVIFAFAYFLFWAQGITETYFVTKRQHINVTYYDQRMLDYINAQPNKGNLNVLYNNEKYFTDGYYEGAFMAAFSNKRTVFEYALSHLDFYPAAKDIYRDYKQFFTAENKDYARKYLKDNKVGWIVDYQSLKLMRYYETAGLIKKEALYGPIVIYKVI